jgi:hypothetical protein
MGMKLQLSRDTTPLILQQQGCLSRNKLTIIICFILVQIFTLARGNNEPGAWEIA